MKTLNQTLNRVVYRRLPAALSASAVLLLAACGGGGGGGTDVAMPQPPAAAPQLAPTDAVPSSANASAQGLVAYLKALAGDRSETKEPVDLTNFSPVRSETASPEPVV